MVDRSSTVFRRHFLAASFMDLKDTQAIAITLQTSGRSCLERFEQLQRKYLYAYFIRVHEHRRSLCVVSWIARHTVTLGTIANTTDIFFKPGLLANVILFVFCLQLPAPLVVFIQFFSAIRCESPTNCDHERFSSARVVFQIYDVLCVFENHRFLFRALVGVYPQEK